MRTIAILLAVLAAVSAGPVTVQNGQMIRFDVFGRMQCRRNCGRAFDDCPPSNCVQPPADRTCPEPNCNQVVNRQFVFASPDPRQYYQCQPIINDNGTYGWTVLTRDCGCMTLFSYALQRCVHPHEWTSDCNATPNPPPAPRECARECPTC